MFFDIDALSRTYPQVYQTDEGTVLYLYSVNGNGFLTGIPEFLKQYSTAGILFNVHNGLQASIGGKADSMFDVLDQEFIATAPPTECGVPYTSLNLFKIEIPDPRTRGVKARFLIPWWTSGYSAVVPTLFSIFAERHDNFGLATTIDFNNFKRIIGGNNPRTVDTTSFLSSINCMSQNSYGARKVVIGSRFAVIDLE